LKKKTYKKKVLMLKLKIMKNEKKKKKLYNVNLKHAKNKSKVSKNNQISILIYTSTQVTLNYYK